MWKYEKPDMEIIILEFKQDVVTGSKLNDGGFGDGDGEDTYPEEDTY